VQLNKKGQLFSTDLIVATIFFLFILVLSVSFSLQVSAKAGSMTETAELNDCAHSVAQQLVLKKGSPASWHYLSNDEINSIGLASERNVLSAEKIQKFLGLNASDYGFLKNSLGVGKFDFWLEILSIDGETLYSAGVFPDDETRVVASVKRIALLGEEEVFVLVKVFD
jgi:hypothetical protein